MSNLKTQWMRRAAMLLAAGWVAALVGCAHPISMEPNGAAVEATAGARVAKKVAYVMADADRERQVTTAGGGGDKVSYFPYRDMERALREALRAVYDDVVVLRSAADAAAVQASGAALVFKPEISTSSSSPSPFTWPPTTFTVDLVCTVTDAAGKELAQLRASGQGRAEFSEFKGDFGLSGKRAAADAAQRLVQEIRADARLR